MTTTRLCLIRHGETTWNAERRLQGHIDIPLNARGAVQARQMAQALKDAKLTFDVLYTSDLKRASDTANAVVQLFGVQAKVESTLRERHFGALQGLSISEAPLLRPDIWQAHISRDLDHELEGGESIQQFALRVQMALDQIQAQHSGKTILIVSHGGTLVTCPGIFRPNAFRDNDSFNLRSRYEESTVFRRTDCSDIARGRSQSDCRGC